MQYCSFYTLKNTFVSHRELNWLICVCRMRIWGLAGIDFKKVVILDVFHQTYVCNLFNDGKSRVFKENLLVS